MPSPAQMREMLAHVMDGTSFAPDSDLSRYAVEGLTPKAAVFPASEEELSALLKEANEKSWAVAPKGSGNADRLGNLPQRLDVVVATKMLPHTIDHNPGDLTVSVGAGTEFGLVQERLAEEGQWLPLDPPLVDRRTVGGILAANLAGPLGLSYGAARDFVLGVRVASAGGTVTKSGGNVVKNVTGFDLPKLHIGALGTLGIILQATLKVIPLPQQDRTLAAAFDDLGKAADVCHEIARSPYTRSGDRADQGKRRTEPGLRPFLRLSPVCRSSTGERGSLFWSRLARRTSTPLPKMKQERSGTPSRILGGTAVPKRRFCSAWGTFRLRPSP